MSNAISFRARLGGEERSFALTSAALAELEQATGSGVLAIYRRVTALEYLVADLVEPIRFGLIGVGENKAQADHLIALHVSERPFAEVYPLTLGIIEARLFGRAPDGEAVTVSSPPEPEPVPTSLPSAPAPAAEADALSIGSD